MNRRVVTEHVRAVCPLRGTFLLLCCAVLYVTNVTPLQANKLLQAANLEPNWLIRAVRAFDNMEAVLTPFGRGTVVNFRPEDGVYEVQ